MYTGSYKDFNSHLELNLLSSATVTTANTPTIFGVSTAVCAFHLSDLSMMESIAR